MWKRMFRHNRISTGLFLLSFAAVYTIMYYGLDLSRQYAQVGTARSESAYQYGVMMQGSIAERAAQEEWAEETPLQEGIVLFQFGGPIGEGIINVDEIDVLWMQKEEMAESVKYEKYYLEDSSITVPSCIIGDAWRDETYEREGIRYIRVMQTECRVAGWYTTNTFENYDKRCLILREGLSMEAFEGFMRGSNHVNILYKSNRTDETEKFKKWAVRFFEKEQDIREEPLETDLWGPVNGYHFMLFASLYRKIYIGMMVLCFINCAFLACFFGKTHLYEYTLKSMLGYGKWKLLTDMISQFAVLEMISLTAVLCITCLYEAVFGDVSVWYQNIRMGFLQIAGISAAFGILLSMFPMWEVLRGRGKRFLEE